MQYNNLLCPVTTIYGSLRKQSMFYVSHMTFYDFQEIFQQKNKMKSKQFLGFEFFNDPCIISRKSYMVLVWTKKFV